MGRNCRSPSRSRWYHRPSIRIRFHQWASPFRVPQTLRASRQIRLHMAVGDLSGRCYGGHQNRAGVSATAEIIMTVLPGEIDRQPDARIGLNLMHFWPQEK